MIDIHILLEQDHITSIDIMGHADAHIQIFPLEKEKTIKNLFSKQDSNSTPKNSQKSLGSIPCAGVSILSKSYIESMALYAVQRKVAVETYMQVKAEKEGELHVSLVAPSTDPQRVHRFAIDQMLVIGLQAVAKEYPNEVKLKIKSKKK